MKSSRPDIVEVEPGVFSVLIDGVSYELRSDASSISINGEVFAFETQDPRQWKRSSGSAAGHGRASITAPMPGKVIRILAAVNDQVEAGQSVIVMEAMKMQNELKSPRAARISAINVKPGDSVNAGAVLVLLD